jgi:small multidrug resistance family-3 protein
LLVALLSGFGWSGKSAVWVLPGIVSLVAFAWLLILIDSDYAGRACAAYGSIYVAASIAWLWFLEGARPDRWDIVGAAVVLVGAVIILFGPRST